MAHVTYSHQQLQLKSIARLKSLYAEIGCKVEVADKRFKNAWISAIVEYQASIVQKVNKLDSQALAQLELDQFIADQAQAVAPERLRAVEITYFDHEYYVGEVMVAAITYDYDLTRPWVVMVNGVEQHRASSWARCNNYIYWHYKQGTLEEALEQQSANSSCPSSTTDNEVIAQISNECEKFGFSLGEVSIYNNGIKLGSVGCTNGEWWFIRVDNPNLEAIFCDSPLDALWWLSRFKNPLVALSIDQHLQYRTIEQMNPNQLRYLLENGELLAA